MNELSLNTSDDADEKQQIQDPTYVPQPPKIVPASVRYKRYKQLANRRNIATSPISTINLSENEEVTFESPKEPSPPIEPKEPRNPSKSRMKKAKRKSFNTLNRKNENQQKEPSKMPSQSTPRTHIPKSVHKQKRNHSPYISNKSDSNKHFEMPSPQVILDIEAVRNQFGSGKIELLPLMQRIQNDQINIQSSRSSLKFNEAKKSVNILNNPARFSGVRPLIDQNKKQIFLPVSSSSSCFDENQAFNKAKNQASARVSKRSYYENF